MQAVSAQAATLEDRLHKVLDQLQETEDELACCRRRGLGRFLRPAG